LFDPTKQLVDNNPRMHARAHTLSHQSCGEAPSWIDQRCNNRYYSNRFVPTATGWVIGSVFLALQLLLLAIVASNSAKKGN
jgi:hypothetical protein